MNLASGAKRESTCAGRNAKTIQLNVNIYIMRTLAEVSWPRNKFAHLSTLYAFIFLLYSAWPITCHLAKAVLVEYPEPVITRVAVRSGGEEEGGEDIFMYFIDCSLTTAHWSLLYGSLVLIEGREEPHVPIPYDELMTREHILLY